MTTIPPQFLALVNDLPNPLQSAISQLVLDLTENFGIAEKTPSSFAAAEADLMGSIIRFGRDADLALASEFAAESSMLAVEFEGETKTFRRLKATAAEVVTPFGPGSIERSLYRETGVHNGPTIDPVAVRCGLLNNATPRAIQLMAAFVAAVPSREAETLLRQLGIETLSRSRIERTAQMFGERLEDHRDELDTTLIEEFDIPAEAVALGVSVDRVSVPIEKPVLRKPGRPRKGDARKPVEVVYEMAYALCWTLYDADRKPLYTARARRMPTDGASYEIEERLRWDVIDLLEKRPDLMLVALSDGAAEMIAILQRVTEGLDVEFQLVDVWHALEYVTEAAGALDMDVSAELQRAKSELKEQEDGAARVLRRLRRWRSKRKKEKKSVPKPLSDAIRYFRNKLEARLMNYAAARAAGLPIGSGTVEATAKTLVSIRMKRAGARWKHRSGQHVLTLRSHLTSERWDDVMGWHVAANDNQMPAMQEVA